MEHKVYYVTMTCDNWDSSHKETFHVAIFNNLFYDIAIDDIIIIFLD